MSLVFAVEVELKTLSLKQDVIYTPSLSIQISDNEETIFPWTPSDDEAENTNFDINKTYQIMVATDLFNAIKSWPIKFNVAMQQDQVITGSTTYEFKPMLASALALCGRSKSKALNAVLKDQNQKVAARLNVVVTVEYIPGNEHTETVEVIASQPIKVQEEAPKVYQPKMESVSTTPEDTEISQSDVSVNSLSSSYESRHSSTHDSSLLQGHSSFKAASQTNRSKLSSAQKTLQSTRSQQISRYQSTAGPNTFTTDFIDEDI